MESDKNLKMPGYVTLITLLDNENLFLCVRVCVRLCIFDVGNLVEGLGML